jgi:hypothetical protein
MTAMIMKIKMTTVMVIIKRIMMKLIKMTMVMVMIKIIFMTTIIKRTIAVL